MSRLQVDDLLRWNVLAWCRVAVAGAVCAATLVASARVLSPRAVQADDGEGGERAERTAGGDKGQEGEEGEEGDQAAACEVAAWFPLDVEAERRFEKTVAQDGEAEDSALTRVYRSEALDDGREALVIAGSDGEVLVLVALDDGAPALVERRDERRRMVERFDPPLQLFPAHARPGEVHRFETTVKQSRGLFTFTGKVTREVELEAGPVAIEVPAGRFEGCLRFRARTVTSVSGALEGEAADIVWLAPGVGEVASQRALAIRTFGLGVVDVKLDVRLAEPAAEALPGPRRERF